MILGMSKILTSQVFTPADFVAWVEARSASEEYTSLALWASITAITLCPFVV